MPNGVWFGGWGIFAIFFFLILILLVAGIN